MIDPWDVKSVRLGHQYHSCMKINGVPLLPPVLSKECRKEMQYYKLLAKEVEKRISILRPYLESDTESCEDRTDASDITECDDHKYVSPLEEKVEATIDFIVDKFSPDEKNSEKSGSHSAATDKYNTQCSEVQDSQIVIDLNVKIGEDRGVYSTVHRSPRQLPEPNDIPERDCDYQKKNKKQKELLTDQETDRKTTQKVLIDNIINFNMDMLSSKHYIPKDGPSSLCSKSFTGSLNDIYADTSKQSQEPKLIRQRSYTVLNPSPQLLAHLEVQSINTGVELSSISMSESMSKLSHSAKKRKSWDLETAKVKWSSMAMELKTKRMVMNSNGANNNDKSRNPSRKALQTSPIAKSTSATQDRRRGSSPSIRAPKSETVQKPRNVQNSVTNIATRKSLVKETPTPINTCASKNSVSPKKDNLNKTALISKVDDPAGRVKKLYEKLQKQQLTQMANLMEKQKQEQHLLQQVFEEQNNILLKQLKTVCPKASIEVKQAWGDMNKDNDRGPVSLSQLINTSTPEHSVPNSPVAKTLTESNSYINKCDSMLKKSRDLTNSIRRQTTKVKTTNGVRSQRSIEPASHSQKYSRKANSPTRNTSRKLNYDTGSSDTETTLTDRTNDTLADLNVTFPSDNSDPVSYTKRNVTRNSRKVYSTRACSPLSSSPGINQKQSMESAIRNLEDSIQTSINSMGSYSVKQGILHRQPNTKELVAATKIVACAKGYLVRRLMRTERVQSTVQTIRDALLCALQLHQDREGIRGADVDLHRRLIQQITAACYTLHDTFVSSSATERCALIAADRARRQVLAAKQPTPRSSAREDVMSQSHSGAFPSRVKRPTSANIMTQSNYETFSSDKSRSRDMAVQQKIPWR